MRLKKVVVGVLGVGLLMGSGVEAGNRLSAFDIQCIAQAKANIAAMVHFTNGTVQSFNNTCLSGQHAFYPWPTIADGSGDVQSMTIAVHVTKSGTPALHNECTVVSGNGYATYQCLADEAGIDEVRGLISIPHIQ